VLWKQAVNRDRKVTANRPDIIIKKQIKQQHNNNNNNNNMGPIS
jgi:hypothetical protein